MSQNRSSAVMQQRAPSQVEADTDLRKKWRDLDFFPTPPWAARACAELILHLDPEARSISDPSCGQGHFLEPCKEYFAECIGADIHDYDRGYFVRDFLRDDMPRVDWIATNPPFSLAKEFAERGLAIARRGVLLLCRIALLESEGRYELLYTGKEPLTICAPFIERVPMQLGGWDPDLRSATAYAAFVWMKGARPRPLLPIAPGTKARLWRDTDVRRFAEMSALPLFEEENP